MNFKPLGERLLIERVEEPTTTASGIIIPDNAKEKPSRGKVIAVSEEIKNIEIGNVVVFGKYSGSEFVVDGKDYLILELKDALGVIL
ncbi:MAG: co-chaperone GroES [Campylobacterota bacterium]|nr:co-chaperone GroES [Campylobacterota bacterium]